MPKQVSNSRSFSFIVTLSYAGRPGNTTSISGCLHGFNYTDVKARVEDNYKEHEGTISRLWLKDSRESADKTYVYSTGTVVTASSVTAPTTERPATGLLSLPCMYKASLTKINISAYIAPTGDTQK